MLSNSRHEAFAVAVATGGTAVDAYRRAFKYTGKNADSLGCRLMSGKVSNQINERVREIQRRAESETVLTVAEMLRFLTDLVRASPADVTDESPFVLRYEKTPNSLKVHFFDKLRAIELAAKLQGFLVEKVE